MSCGAVFITTDVHRACMTHAHMTQSEEIMGFLLGNTETNEHGKTITLLWAVETVPRKDKKRDRVEVEADQQIEVQQRAAEMTERTGRPTRAVGWYHSHPGYIVKPSAVDLRSQMSVQLIDEGFVGLIYSVFSPKEKELGFVDRVEAIAFQTTQTPSGLEQYNVPLYVVPSSQLFAGEATRAMVGFQKLSLKEAEIEYLKAQQVADNPIMRAYQASVYHKRLSMIIQFQAIPGYQQLMDEDAALRRQLSALEERKQELREKLRARSDLFKS